MSSSKFALTGHADGVVTFHCPPRRYFETYKPSDFARGGCEAQFDFKLKAGQLDQPFSMAEQLRKLGLPVKLEDGILSMTQDLTVCQAGQILTPEQAKILVRFPGDAWPSSSSFVSCNDVATFQQEIGKLSGTTRESVVEGEL